MKAPKPMLNLPIYESCVVMGTDPQTLCVQPPNSADGLAE